jgi:hypothetical protein
MTMGDDDIEGNKILLKIINSDIQDPVRQCYEWKKINITVEM